MSKNLTKVESINLFSKHLRCVSLTS
jgi:hypothetical protein